MERLGKKHGLAMVDALQLVTILHGQFKHMGPNSASVLNTADNGLAEAAQAEHLKMWDCR